MKAENKLEGLIYNLSDECYHKVLGPDEASYSSSQFKDAVNDIEYFYKKYISKEIVEEHGTVTLSNFAIGHAYHCLTLEPEKFDEGFAIFTGAVKRGKAYEDFLANSGDKKILSEKQLETAKFIAEASNRNTISKSIREDKDAKKEVSLFTELHGVRVKVRADLINFEKGLIMDMKSTTGNPKDAKKIAQKISSLDYDLSAALYMDAFNEYLGKKGLPLITEWKFCFDSKDMGTSKVYTATEDMIKVGRAKYMKGLSLIKKYQANGWKFTDTDDLIDLPSWDKQDWLTEEKAETLIVEENSTDLL